ncbi:MAG: hypothetical protein H8E62_08530 [Planctomycetes bacterium]|nr:hypothetical protein [Planctomycetota bacterium]
MFTKYNSVLSEPITLTNSPELSRFIFSESGTVTAVYRTVDGDPNTAIPGWWNIGLEVTDGNGTSSGGTGYNRIDQTCGEMTVENPDDDYDLTYDVNLDCIIDVTDFEAYAAKWLTQGAKYE